YPHVQLPREPADRPPDQAHRAPARPRPRGRPRRVHGCARVGRAAPQPRERRRLSSVALTIREVLARSAEFLERKGVENPRLDAERLLAHALGLSRVELYTEFE